MLQHQFEAAQIIDKSIQCIERLMLVVRSDTSAGSAVTRITGLINVRSLQRRVQMSGEAQLRPTMPVLAA